MGAPSFASTMVHSTIVVSDHPFGEATKSCLEKKCFNTFEFYGCSWVVKKTFKLWVHQLFFVKITTNGDIKVATEGE